MQTTCTTGSSARGSVLTPFSTPIFRVKLPDLRDTQSGSRKHHTRAQENAGKQSPQRAGLAGSHRRTCINGPSTAVQKLCKLSLDVVSGGLGTTIPAKLGRCARLGDVLAQCERTRKLERAASNHGGFPWVASCCVRTEADGVHMGGIYFQNPMALAYNVWQGPSIRA